MTISVKTKTEAWNLASKLFDGDYIYDLTGSKRAGYPIYRSTLAKNNPDYYYDYICDLGVRLELNFHNTVKSISIWFDEDDETPKQIVHTGYNDYTPIMEE